MQQRSTVRRKSVGLLRALSGLGLVLLLVLRLVPSTALAHADLERAEPPLGAVLPSGQPPKELHLFFSEEVDPGFSRVEVLNARRERVDRNDSHVAPGNPRELIVSLQDKLPDGVYTVAWRTLSLVDGHSVTGSYPMIVGAAPEGTAVQAASSQALFAPETAVARWWFYTAASVLFGTLLACWLVYAPAAARRPADLQPVLFGPLRRLALVTGVVLLLGILYGALAQAAVASGKPLWSALGPPLIDVLGHGRYPLLWWPRLGLAAIAVALITWRGIHGWAARLALVALAASLLTSSLNSHLAALSSGPYIGIASDWVHLLAASAWIGGLVSLLVVMPAVLRWENAGKMRTVADIAGRFSSLAFGAVVVILLTGILNAWLEVGTLRGLWETACGWSILAKTAGLLLMLGLAAFNLLAARPALAAQAQQGASGLQTALRFGRAVRAEAGIGLVVLAAAAILTGLVPAREELARRDLGDTGGPVDRRLDAQGLAARVQVMPAAVGQNHLRVELPGTDPSRVERVQLTLTYLDAELGDQPLVLTPSTPGIWALDSPALSQPGSWQAELFVRRPGQEDARSAFRFRITGLGGEGSQAASATASYPLLPSVPVSLALATLALGAGILVYGGWQAMRGRRAMRQTMVQLAAAGLLAMAAAGYVYVREQQSGVPLDVVNVRDPVPPDQRSLAAGGETYQANCAVCHGVSGRGDGPGGFSLRPRPADLRVHMAAGHTDGQLFYWVSYGRAGTAMTAWKDHLTEQQRWDVINYIRTFALVPTPGPAAGRAPSP